MTLRLVLNPVSGQFDYVDIPAAGTYAAPTPTEIPANTTYTVPDKAQVLHVDGRPIIMNEGSKIVLGDGSLMVTVD